MQLSDELVAATVRDNLTPEQEAEADAIIAEAMRQLREQHCEDKRTRGVYAQPGVDRYSHGVELTGHGNPPSVTKRHTGRATYEWRAT